MVIPYKKTIKKLKIIKNTNKENKPNVPIKTYNKANN